MMYYVDYTPTMLVIDRLAEGEPPELAPNTRRFTARDATDLDVVNDDTLLRCLNALGYAGDRLPPEPSDLMFKLLGEAAEFPIGVQSPPPAAEPADRPTKKKNDPPRKDLSAQPIALKTSSSGDGKAPMNEEKQMSNETETVKKKTPAKKKVAKKKSDGPRGEKTLMVKKLLERKSGCTRKDILEATGWPAVSVQAMAKSCGLKLRQEKEKGKPTVYFGT